MKYAAARRNMVESQLRTGKVSDAALLEVFASVPREKFAPAPRRAVAYVDDDLPVGSGRYLMEPMVLARLIQLAGPEPTESVLDVACGTGYSTAILAGLAGRVVGLECEPGLAQLARESLSSHGAANATVVECDLTAGWPTDAPYDVILINGMIEVLPSALSDQIAEGGRLVCVQRRDGVGRAVLATRTDGIVSSRVVFEAAVPPLVAFLAPPEFVF
jgi:protein-L-isoaspartate(D-aspartate) O-methyltransferase